MDGMPQTLLTLFAAFLAIDGADWLTVLVMVIALFFWLITLKRKIQKYHHNSIWEAIKSLFKKYNKYGE